MMNEIGIKLNDPMSIAGIDTTTLTDSELKPLVIYHGNCADGFSAAWCFWDISNKNFDFHPGIYSDAPPDVTDRVVYLVDFSYKCAVVEEMLHKAKHIYLIDHHKTAIEDLLFDGKEYDGFDLRRYPNFTAYVDLDRSGAMLAWDFLHNVQWVINESGLATEIADEFILGHEQYVAPPLLLEHIQDRDLWKFKLPLTREIQANVFSYEYTFENWDKLMKANRAELVEIAVGGMAIERKHHKDIAELVKVCQRNAIIGGCVVPVASLPYIFSSDAGHLMAKTYMSGKKFAACYWDTATHRIFSLRSTEEGMDVSEIAKQYGGGGHKHAAGFRVDRHHDLAGI